MEDFMTKEEKCRNTQKGRIVIHNKQGVEKRVYKNELNDYLSQGYVKGRSPQHSINNSLAQKGKPKPSSSHPISEKQKQDISNTLKRKYKTGEITHPLKGKKLNYSPEKIKIMVTKGYLTKKLNGTLNTSKPEEDLYKQLLKENENKHIYRNYKCDRYPYYCDFYIEEDDLFIELHAH
jgi:hypothetical protein